MHIPLPITQELLNQTKPNSQAQVPVTHFIQVDDKYRVISLQAGHDKIQGPITSTDSDAECFCK